MAGRFSTTVSAATMRKPARQPLDAMTPFTTGENAAPARPLQLMAMEVARATPAMNHLLMMVVANTKVRQPAERPRSTQSRYMGMMELQSASAAVEAASTAVAPIISGLRLFSESRRGTSIPPTASEMLQMVGMRLACPRRMPNSSMSGVKKRPDTLVTRPMPEASSPHIPMSTRRCLPEIFMGSLPRLPKTQ